MTRSSWSILWVAFLAGVIATLVQFSIPPVMPILQDQFALSYTDSALLMSLFALATLLAAVPGGFIVQRYGVRNIGLLAIAILLLGIVVCFFANTFAILLLGRIIGGIGFGLVSVAAPSAIGQYIPPRMMSIAMGIWSIWIPLGSLVMFLLAPKVVLTFQSSVYWILLMGILVIGFLLYARFIPKMETKQGESHSIALPKEIIKSEIKNMKVWWLAIAFASFTICLFSFTTWISTYLTETSSMSLVAAAFVPSIVSIFLMFSNFYSGVILQKLGNRFLLFLMLPLVFSLTWPIFTTGSLPLLYTGAIIIGLVGGFIPTVAFSSAPLLAKRKETIGIAMSIVIIGENVGILIGPEVFGFMRELTGSFVPSFWMLLFFGLINVVASLQIWRSGVFAKAGEKKTAPAPELNGSGVLTEEV